MTENSDELHMFGVEDNLGAPFFPGADSSNQRDFQKPTSHSTRENFREHICLDDNFVTDHLSPNDCLSDETHFEKHTAESNENSNQPSPAKSGATTVVKAEVDVNQYHSEGSDIPKFAGASLLNEDSDPHSDETKEGQIDITDFIDNFLGDDDIMQNVPEIADGLKIPRGSSIPLDDASSKISEGKHADAAGFSMLQNDTALSPPLALKQPSVQNTLQQTNRQQEESRTVQTSPSKASGPPAQEEKGSWPSVRVVAPSSQGSVRRPEKRKPRTYSQAVPSQHCHICSRRPTEGSPHQVCGNLQKGRCRKTICTKCFHQFRWDLNAARQAPPGTWECPHCRGQCPQRAQCVIYNRTSDRRRLKLINHRKRKSEDDNIPKDQDGGPQKKRALGKPNCPNIGKTGMPSVLSMDNKKSIATIGASPKTRASTFNSKKLINPKPKKKLNKSQGMRKVTSKKDEPKKILQLKATVRRDLSDQMFGGHKSLLEQQGRAQILLEQARMMEQSRVMIENNSRCMQDNLHVQSVLATKDIVDLGHASYMMSPGSPRRGHLSKLSLQHSRPSANAFITGIPPSMSDHYHDYHPVDHEEAFFSLGVNHPQVQNEVSLKPSDYKVQKAEVSGQIHSAALSIEDIWPKASTVEHDAEVPTPQETLEDLWMFQADASDSPAFGHKENELNLADPGSQQVGNVLSFDRFEYPEAGGFEEKGHLGA